MVFTLSSAVIQTLTYCLACLHTGRVLDQQQRVRCHSKQDQSAAAQQGGPDISRLDPDLQKQWDHAANVHLGNVDIAPQSRRKVGWTCDQCPDGHLHSWSAAVQNRTNGSGCPQCSGRKVCKHNSLATKAPAVAAQWDYEANDGTPDGVVAQSNQPAHWHCDACGHEWRATICTRVSKLKRGCPQCAKTARTKKKYVKQPTIAENPVLLAQWDHSRNAEQGHFPDRVRLQSAKQIFWLCNMCSVGQQHSWPAGPYNRTGRAKSGCPFCAGHAACKCNSLQALYPSIAAEWDHGKNKSQPCEHTAGSTHMAWWSSPQRGSWQQTIRTRTSNIQKKSVMSKRAQERLNSASPP